MLAREGVPMMAQREDGCRGEDQQREGEGTLLQLPPCCRVAAGVSVSLPSPACTAASFAAVISSLRHLPLLLCGSSLLLLFLLLFFWRHSSQPVTDEENCATHASAMEKEAGWMKTGALNRDHKYLFRDLFRAPSAI